MQQECQVDPEGMVSPQVRKSMPVDLGNISAKYLAHLTSIVATNLAMDTQVTCVAMSLSLAERTFAGED